ncbi:DUF3352 domain-containing protein [Candidatus Sumerlaeota bacterium]|nr:DUF3352 domain-containing protein [Candidatus Sumerlaeota bacterium]
MTVADCVPGQTLVFVHAKNLSDLRESWRETPLYTMWTEPKFEAFFRPAKDRLRGFETNAEEGSGLSVAGLEELFPGEVAFFLSDLIYTVRQSEILYIETNWGFMGRFSGDADKVKDLVENHVLKDVPSDARRSVEPFRGVPIYTTVFVQKIERPIPEPGAPGDADEGLALPDASVLEGPEYHYEYAILDDLCIVLEGQRAYMKTVLTNLFDARESGRSGASLAATENYRRALGTLGDEPDAMCYVNIERLLEQVQTHPVYSTLSRMPSLRLEELKSGAVGLRLPDEGIAFDLALCSAPSPQGVARFLVNDRVNSFRTRNMVPSDAIAYSCSLVDFAGLYSLLRTALTESNAQYGVQLDAVTAMIAQRTQVDVVDLIGRLRGEMATFSRPAGGSLLGGDGGKETGAFLLELDRPEGFAPALARVVESTMQGGAAPLKAIPAAFEGFDLYTLGPDPAQTSASGLPPGSVPSFSFAVANSFLVASPSAEAAKEVLRLVSGSSVNSVAQNEKFEKATAGLRPGYCSLEWRDLRRTVEGLAEVVRSPRFRFAFSEWVRVDAMPAPEALAEYFDQWVLAGYTSKDSYRFSALLMDPKGGGGGR